MCFATQAKKRHGLTFEDCLEEAKKHDSKSLRKSNSHGVQQNCPKQDWAEKIFAHYNDRPYQRWDFETCKAEAEKYTTTKALRTQAAGAYAAIIRNGWRDPVDGAFGFVAPGAGLMPHVTRWTFEKCAELAAGFTNKADFCKAYRGIGKAWEYEWLADIITRILIPTDPMGCGAMRIAGTG